MRFTLAVMLAALLLQTAACSQPKPLSYPADYRKWQLVKSAMISEGEALFEPFGGIHHIYRNEAAAKAAESGQPYPEGSIFVFDLYETKDSENGPVEGNRKFLAIMEKRAELFGATGGWGYQAFKGEQNEAFVTDAKKDCYACHESEAPRDYIFSAAGNR